MSHFAPLVKPELPRVSTYVRRPSADVSPDRSRLERRRPRALERVRSRLLFVVVGLALFTLPRSAEAQDACFAVAGESARAQYVVGLHTTFRLNARCQYAVRPEGPWAAPGELATRDTDFLEAYALAAAQGTASGDPRLLLGRPTQQRRGAQVVQHSVLLRYCAHYLLEEQLGFRVIPGASGEGFRIERGGGTACDSPQIELRAVRGARPERISSARPEQTLSTGQASLSLEQGDWSVFAARPGSSAGLRVGVFRSQRTVTPLANHLRSVGIAQSDERPAPLFAARFAPGAPGMLLAPTDEALRQELLWPELRTAADAGVLWLAALYPDGPRVVAPLELEAGDPSAVRVPDRVVREHMRSVYGEVGQSVAPSGFDWRQIVDTHAVCLTPSYHASAIASSGSAVPDAGMCASLGRLTVFAQAAANESEARVCLRRGVQVMSARGARYVAGEQECFELPPTEVANEVGHAPPYRVAVVGDRIRLNAEGLCVVLDNRPLEAGEGGEYLLERAGFLEVRQSGGQDCAGPQAIARIRIPVLDPEHEWHPIGLYTGATEAQIRCGSGDERMCPWRVLAHDENEVFAFVEPRNELELGLSMSPLVANVFNSMGGPVQFTESVPMLAGIRGQLPGARIPAVVAYASRDAACPNGEEVTYASLRQQPPLDVDDLAPDAVFHVHLLAVAREDAPVSCLARASFRIRPSRAVANITVEDFLGLELGFLGDTQAVFFANDPIALGLALPLVWFRLTPGQRWLSFDVAANLVMAASFEPAELSRVGVSLSWALTFGVPDYLPRLLSVGGMLHGAAQTSTIDNPIVSFYIGLNLSALIDLAGGR